MQEKDNSNLGRNFGLPFRSLWLDPLACILTRSMNHPLEAFLKLKSTSLQVDSILPQPCQLPQGEFTHLFFKENKLISSTSNNFPACGNESTATPHPNLNHKYFWSAVQACSPSATPFTSISATFFSRQMAPTPSQLPLTPCQHHAHPPLSSVLSLTQFPQIWQTTVSSFSLKRNSAPARQDPGNLVRQMGMGIREWVQGFPMEVFWLFSQYNWLF